MTHKQMKTMANQNGAVLVIALIILIILGVAATTGVNQVVQENQLSSNMDRYQRNFQAADSMLSWCEDSYFLNRSYAPIVDDSKLYGSNKASLNTAGWWKDSTNWTSLGVNHDNGLANNDRGIEATKCICQEVENTAGSLNLPNKMANQKQSSLIRKNGIRQYRVSAYAKALNSENSAIVQSDYFARFE